MRLLRIGLVAALVGWFLRAAGRSTGHDDLWQRATAEADARDGRTTGP